MNHLQAKNIEGIPRYSHSSAEYIFGLGPKKQKKFARNFWRQLRTFGVNSNTEFIQKAVLKPCESWKLEFGKNVEIRIGFRGWQQLSTACHNECRMLLMLKEGIRSGETDSGDVLKDFELKNFENLWSRIFLQKVWNPAKWHTTSNGYTLYLKIL